MSDIEDLVRDALRAKATEAVDTLTFEDVRRGAAAKRRRSLWLRAGAVVAAAAVAVGIPAAFLMRPDDHSPRPAHPSPTSASTSTGGVLAQLPQSDPPGITYLVGHTIHLASGGTTTLPGPAGVSAFAAYHGGWLVGDAVMPGVRWYDNTGALEREGIGSYLLAASADGTRLAFTMVPGIRIGITSGMGEGEQMIPVTGDHPRAWPVGFLSDGALVYNDAGVVKTDHPIAHPVPAAMDQAEAVSVNDLVAGVDAEGRGLAWSARTGQTVWSDSDWLVTSFSADGRYAAAMRPTGAGGKAVAILDARTGNPVVENVLTESGLDPVTPVMETDGSLLFVGVDTKSEDSAVIRMLARGEISRASEIVHHDPIAEPTAIVFATGP